MRLIDADALKEIFLQDRCGDNFLPKHFVISTIDNYPTVDLKDIYQEGHYDGHLERYTKAINEERPQGEWIVKVERYGCYVGDRTVYSYTCPFCGRKEFGTYPFCHCGAELRGEEK